MCRRYGRDEVVRVLLIARSQHAGMSLAQIRALVDASVEGRRGVLEAHLEALDALERDLECSRRMTRHALECDAHDVTTCPNFVTAVGDLSTGAIRWNRTGPADRQHE